jgi:hypothetical protein
MESRAELDVGPVDQAVATRARVRLAGASLDRTAAAVALALIVLAAGWLRFSGADWDRGAHLHPDERYLSTVANDVRWPSSVPAYFDVATSPLSPYNVESGRHYSYGTLPLFGTKLVASLSGRGDYDHLYLVGRRLSALLDLLTVLLVFLAGRIVLRDLGPRRATQGGLLAAALYALTVAALQAAHFFTTDTWLVFFGMLTFVLAARSVEAALRRPGERFPTLVAWAGVAAGLTVASKVSGLFVAIPVAVALAGRAAIAKRSAGGTKALLGLGADALAFLLPAYLAFRLASPYAFHSSNWLDPALSPEFRAALQEQRDILSGRALFPPTFQWLLSPRGWDPLRNLVVWQLGVAFGLCALAGAGLLVSRLARPVVARVRRGQGGDWPSSREALAGATVHLMVVGFVGVVFVYMSTLFQHMGRYLLPIIPLLAVAAAYGVVVALDARGRLLALAVTAVLAPTAAYAVAFHHVYAGPSTRIAATDWITANAPAGSTIANEHWDDALPVAASEQRYRLVFAPVFEPDDATKARRLYTVLDDADYYVLSSPRAWRTIGRLPDRFPLMVRFYRELFAGRLGFQRVARFKSGPRLLGVSVDDIGAEEAFSVYDHPQVNVFRRKRQLTWPAFRRLLCPAAGEPACT